MAKPVARERIRVGVVCELAVPRDALRALLEREADLVPAGDEAAAPDIVLVDSDHTAERVAPTLREVRTRHPRARVLVLTARNDRSTTARLVRDGAHGAVFKGRSSAHLMDAIRKVHAGELWVDRVVATELIASLTKAALSREDDDGGGRAAALTARERDIVALVASGLPNKAIGLRLAISDNTVRHHLTSIFAKLGVSDRLSLVVYSHKHRLV